MLKNYWEYINEERSGRSIEQICDYFGIMEYTINGDGTVDADNVNLIRSGLKELPLKFGKVTGDFLISGNSLTTLEGCPYSVGGTFDCSTNYLNSFVGGPKELGAISPDGLICEYNDIRSFEGFPLKHREGVRINMWGNPIHELCQLFDLTDLHPAIPLMNEWEVIDPEDMTISYSRLLEVFGDLGRDPLEQDEIKLKKYTLVD